MPCNTLEYFGINNPKCLCCYSQTHTHTYIDHLLESSPVIVLIAFSILPKCSHQCMNMANDFTAFLLTNSRTLRYFLIFGRQRLEWSHSQNCGNYTTINHGQTMQKHSLDSLESLHIFKKILQPSWLPSCSTWCSRLQDLKLSTDGQLKGQLSGIAAALEVKKQRSGKCPKITQETSTNNIVPALFA